MKRLICCLIVGFTLAVANGNAFAQTYGIELHNNVMPASGAMGGTSFSRPQDVQSAINGNPATTTQYQGTVSSFGGALVEPTYNVTQTAPLPLFGVTPYSAKSDTPLSLVGNIGVIHNTQMMGTPVTIGFGFLTNAGLGVDFRPVTNSNGTHASYTALDLVNSYAVQVTSNLSVGAAIGIGTSFLDGPFVGSSSMQADYAPRFTFGANYDLGSGVSLGGFWQSKKQFEFDNVVQLQSGRFVDVDLDHPSNFGFGIANRCLMDGRLLVAADVLYKNWEDTEFFRALYKDQWALQFGSQYLVNDRLKLRSGYAYNTDPTRDTVPGNIGPIAIGSIPGVQYIQGQFAAISQHRLTGGFGISEMMPGVDFDATLGGVFAAEKSFGATTTNLKGYFVSFGFTWRRGASSPGCYECSPSQSVPMVQMSHESNQNYD